MYQVTAPLPEEPTITQAVIKAQRTLIIEDALASPYISPRLAAAFPIRSCLGIPLMAGDQILGACIIAFHQPHHFNLDEVMRSEQAAGQVALGVANGQLLLRLEQARKVAEEASRLKSEFLANTSHELRTPLNGILGSLKLVLDDLCDTPEEERQFVGTAYEAARRLLRIIDDLLDIAKIEAGKMEVALQAVDVAPLLLDVYNLTQAQAGQKGLAFAVEAPPATAPRVWANAESLRQILLNLVGNALKFTERGHVRVRSRVEPGQRQMHLLVEDTGIGIAPEAQARLFAPFVQADGSTTRQYGGTGLGLSISRRLAELMGGTLTLHSAGEGQGSTFTLTLPLVSHGE
jgi:signal transduction histidine kinase